MFYGKERVRTLMMLNYAEGAEAVQRLWDDSEMDWAVI